MMLFMREGDRERKRERERIGLGMLTTTKRKMDIPCQNGLSHYPCNHYTISSATALNDFSENYQSNLMPLHYKKIPCITLLH